MVFGRDDHVSEQTFGPVLIPGPVIPGNSWKPVREDNPAPAKPALMVAAMPFFFMLVGGGTATLPPPDLSWGPSYPDFAIVEKVHASQQRPFFGVERLPDIPFDPADATFAPQYVDIVPRNLGIPSLGGSEGFLGAPFNNRHEPVYPNWIEPPRGLHASQQAFYFGQTEEIPVPFDPTTDHPEAIYPDQVVVSPIVPSYGSIKGSLFAGFGSTFYPTYPDLIEPPRGLSAAQQRAFFMDLEPIAPSVDPIRPVYPDAVEPIQGLAAHQQRAYFAPDQVAELEEFHGFRPVYPDFAPGLAIHPSQVPFEFREELPDTDQLWWRPVYPDAIDRLVVRAAEQRAFFAPDQRPAIPFDPTTDYPWPEYPAQVVRLSGMPSLGGTEGLLGAPLRQIQEWTVYPDFIEAPRGLQASAQRAFFFDPEPISDFDPTTVPQVFYPDFAPGLQYLTANQEFLFRPDELPELEEFHQWRGVYPDFAPGLHLEAAQQRAFFFDPEPILVPQDELQWRPEYPDFARARVYLTANQAEFFRSVLPRAAAPELSWHPLYPDAVEPPSGLATYQQRAFFFDPEPRAAFDAAQIPRVFYPDFARGGQHHAWLDPFFFKPELTVVDRDELAWRPTYPDYINRLEVRAADVPFFFSELVPKIPDPSTPDYPDFARADELHASQVPFLFRPDEEPEVETQFGYWPVYPDFARGRARAADFPAYFPPSIWPPNTIPPELAWEPEYPSQFAAWSPQVHASRVPSFWWIPGNDLPAPSVVGYTPVFPDFAWGPKHHAELDPFFFAPVFWPPLTIPPDLAWEPEYPAFARAQEPAAEFPFFFPPGFWPPNTPTPELAWDPSYPDFARGLPQPADLPAYFPPAFWPPVTVIPDLSWQPSYPDFARELEPHAWRDPFVFNPGVWPPTVPPPELSWEATYPDWLPGPYRPELLGTSFTTSSETPDAGLWRRFLQWRIGRRTEHKT